MHRQVTCEMFTDLDLVEKMTFRSYSLTQIISHSYMVKYSFPDTKNCLLEVSMVRCSHFVIFNFLQGKVVCFGTRFQVACLDRVQTLCRKNVIFRLCCLLHEDGIVEACIPGSI